MPKRSKRNKKNKVASQRANLELREYETAQAIQPTLIGIPENQISTFQVPCGPFSIWDALEAKEVTQADCMVYQTINRYSDWDSGNSNALSHNDIAKRSGVSISQVKLSLRKLIKLGWLKKNVRNATEKHGQNEANTYLVTHHNCLPHQIPLDDKGRPKKCAVPSGQGSVFYLIEDGKIGWKEALLWIRAKIESDWTDGILEDWTLAKIRKCLRMKTKTIATIKKHLKKIGLMVQLSKPFKAFTAQLFPKPYEKRRTRRAAKGKKPMRNDGEFYYSYNERWRVSRQDGHIETKLRPGEGWRYASEFELEKSNKSIYKDFMPIVELILSPSYQRLKAATA